MGSRHDWVWYCWSVVRCAVICCSALLWRLSTADAECVGCPICTARWKGLSPWSLNTQACILLCSSQTICPVHCSANGERIQRQCFYLQALSRPWTSPILWYTSTLKGFFCSKRLRGRRWARVCGELRVLFDAEGQTAPTLPWGQGAGLQLLFNPASIWEKHQIVYVVCWKRSRHECARHVSLFSLHNATCWHAIRARGWDAPE